MKRFILGIFAIGAMIEFFSCNNNNAESTATADSTTMSTTTTSSYVSLKTGQPVKLDQSTGKYVDESGAPVAFYVDANTKDTFYGESGQVVNNAIIYDTATQDWHVDEAKIQTTTTTEVPASEPAATSGDVKIKKEGDEVKVKKDK